jgi:hypothetical protein
VLMVAAAKAGREQGRTEAARTVKASTS